MEYRSDLKVKANDNSEKFYSVARKGGAITPERRHLAATLFMADMMTALLLVPNGVQKAREFTHVIATAHLDMAQKSDKAVVDILGENVFERKKQITIVFLSIYSVQFDISNQGHCIPKCTAMSPYSLKSFINMILK